MGVGSVERKLTPTGKATPANMPPSSIDTATRDEASAAAYRAFLSYSHADAKVARWLHRRLEGYRFPKGLTLDDGGAPGRLAPIFRDREELPAGASLSDDLIAALRGSEALVVICSRRSARSTWVDREIETFLEHHGRERVFAVIVDGKAGLPSGDDNSCYPPALYGENGSADLVAPDLRPGGDGRRLGFLKLVAGLAGLRLDALIQRDQQRAIRRLRLTVALSLTAVLTFAALGTALHFQRREAIRQRDLAREVRDRAQEMNSYFLTDLRKKLRALGRLDLLDEATERVIAYQDSLPSELSDDPEVLRARAIAMDYVGQMLLARGEPLASAERLRESRAAWLALQARADVGASAWSGAAVNAQMLGEAWSAAGRPGEELRAYELGLEALDGLRATDDEGRAHLARLRSMLLASAGEASYRLGDTRRALDDLDEAAAFAKSATESRPGDRGNWDQAVAAFLSLARYYLNVGDLENAPLQARAAVEAAEARARLDLEDADGWRLLANAQGTLMMAHVARGEWTEAESVAREKLGWRGRTFERDPSNPTAEAELANSEDDLAFVLTYRDEVDEADEFFSQAISRYAGLLQAHPGRHDWRRAMALIFKRRGDLAFRRETWDLAREDYENSIRLRRTLLEASPGDTSIRVDLANLQLARGEALWKLRRLDEAAAAMREAETTLAPPAVPHDHPGARSVREGLSRAMEDLAKDG